VVADFGSMAAHPSVLAALVVVDIFSNGAKMVFYQYQLSDSVIC
jgi:hypothetical protein